MRSILRTAIVLVACSALAACDEAEDTAEREVGPRPVKAVQVGTTSLLGQRSFSGRAQASQEAALAFRVSGRIIDRRINVGDILSQGDVVAVLDDSTYQADVNRLEADLAAAEADFKAKDDQYKRVITLVESGTYSEARGDQARGTRDSAEAAVASVRSALARAELDLTYTVLNAPFEGRVVAVYAENFEEVQAQQSITRLLDISSVEMVIDVPETMIVYAPLVEEVTVTFDAFPDTQLTGRIVEIGAEATQTTRTYPVRIRMTQPEGVSILPGMAGNARATKIATSEVMSGIIVPASALRPVSHGSQEMAVWVVDAENRTVSLRPVSVERAVSGGAAVTEGLEDGDWIVTAGTFSLTEGQEVRLPEAGAGAGQ